MVWDIDTWDLFRISSFEFWISLDGRYFELMTALVKKFVWPRTEPASTISK
jgi:hypothetical protein